LFKKPTANPFLFGFLINMSIQNYKLNKKKTKNYKGETKIWEGRSGNWEELKSVTILAKTKTVENGYQIELSVPFTLLKKQSKSHFRVNFGLGEYTSAAIGYEENVANSNAESSNTWLHTVFQ